MSILEIGTANAADCFDVSKDTLARAGRPVAGLPLQRGRDRNFRGIGITG